MSIKEYGEQDRGSYADGKEGQQRCLHRRGDYDPTGYQKLGDYEIDPHGTSPVSFLTLKGPAAERAAVIHPEAAREKSPAAAAGAAEV